MGSKQIATRPTTTPATATSRSTSGSIRWSGGSCLPNIITSPRSRIDRWDDSKAEAARAPVTRTTRATGRPGAGRRSHACAGGGSTGPLGPHRLDPRPPALSKARGVEPGRIDRPPLGARPRCPAKRSDGPEESRARGRGRWRRIGARHPRERGPRGEVGCPDARAAGRETRARRRTMPGSSPARNAIIPCAHRRRPRRAHRCRLPDPKAVIDAHGDPGPGRQDARPENGDPPHQSRLRTATTTPIRPTDSPMPAIAAKAES